MRRNAVLISVVISIGLAIGLIVLSTKSNSKPSNSTAKTTKTTTPSVSYPSPDKSTDPSSETGRIENKTNRKNIITNIMTTIEEYSANHNGKYPTAAQQIDDFCGSLKFASYLEYSLPDVKYSSAGGAQSSSTRKADCSVPGHIDVDFVPEVQSFDSSSVYSTVFIGSSMQCDDGIGGKPTPTKTNNSRQVAVWMQHAWGYECVDNS
jgi:hypothetical protein